jgi:hypothetical protein
MNKTRTMLSSLLLTATILQAQAAERPVLVELFTSEGCSSCPPADALLAALAERPNVLPLSLHVDYWDRLGWKDPFSSPEATARQQNYARLLGTGTVYTPQMVVDGAWEAVGSDQAAVESTLEKAQLQPAALPVTLAVEKGRARVAVNRGVGAAGASVVLIGFDRRRIDRVERGENAGRTLAHIDVVRGIEEVGRLTGGAGEITAAVPWPSDRLAAIVQAPDGRVLGVAVADLRPL